MPRVLGVDPGTLSLDLCGLADDGVFLDAVIPTGGALADAALAAIAGAGPLDLIVGPSGYGLPLLPIDQVGEPELRLAFLPDPGRGDRSDRGEGGRGIDGLRALVRRLAAARLPVVFPPGVLHLPTVPVQRKANRIDLGTADKVCAAALAILDQATRLGTAPGDTAFILVELGGAFTAVLAVSGGAIVDGCGGSSGAPGYLGSGALDGEVACLLGQVGKGVVFSGGAAWLAGAPDEAPERLAERSDAGAQAARAALVEGVLRTVAGELALVPEAREILLSGRLARVPAWRSALERALAALGRPVRAVTPLAARTKEAAQGAAIVANGLAGGRHAAIVEAMRLREAAGTVLDHLYVDGAAARRAAILGWRGDAKAS